MDSISKLLNIVLYLYVLNFICMCYFELFSNVYCELTSNCDKISLKYISVLSFSNL